MDLKNLNLNGVMENVEGLAKKIGGDKDLLAGFTKDPVATLKSKLGVNLPDDQIKKVADAIKAKLNLDKAGDLLGGVTKLFKK